MQPAQAGFTVVAAISNRRTTVFYLRAQPALICAPFLFSEDRVADDNALGYPQRSLFSEAAFSLTHWKLL